MAELVAIVGGVAVGWLGHFIGYRQGRRYERKLMTLEHRGRRW